ncbi:PREDICTED: dual specificity protein kinase splA-like, partial [Rhagoletis zephyria]|uniref:dual specificity protein kinase splA-like n=1 Tax=Rhagoletis zephyria TaxID=28612 RepID=UPI00081185BC
MSTGLKVLLDAAQYIEHQEKLKRSPIPASTDSTELCYVGQCSTEFDILGGVSSNNNNNNNVINTRSARTTTDIIQQVSSSAPASSATFHHLSNGVIITNNNSSLTGSQLVVEARATNPKQNNNRTINDYEFTRNISGTIATLKGSSRVSHSSKSSSTHTNSATDEAVNDSSITEDTFSSKSNKVQEHQEQLLLQQIQDEHSKGNSGPCNKSKTYRLVESGGEIVVVTAAANKQMLLNDGLRVASPAATLGDASSKAISIPKQTQQHHSVASKLLLVNSTSAPHSLRYKSTEPLTPPPVATNQPLLNNGDHGEMIVEDRNAMHCIGGDHSPSRQNSTGSHYLQLMSAQHAAVGSQIMHVTPTIGGSGRRRTISSNSNG